MVVNAAVQLILLLLCKGDSGGELLAAEADSRRV